MDTLAAFQRCGNRERNTRNGNGGFNSSDFWERCRRRRPALRPRRQQDSGASTKTGGDVRVTPSWAQLSDERPLDVLGALPRRRPHRRSEKRSSATPAGRSAPDRTEASDGVAEREPAANGGVAPRARGTRPASSARKAPAARNATPALGSETIGARRPERLRQPAQPAGAPPMPPRTEPPDPTTGTAILGIAAQAAAELAEIGLSVSARALRNAVSRLPRP